MKKTISCLAFAAAVFGFAGPALAADDAMMPAKPDMMHVATMLCRPATDGEKSNAMTAAKGALVCKPVDMPKMMTMKKTLEAMPNGEPLWLEMFQTYHIEANGV